MAARYEWIVPAVGLFAALLLPLASPAVAQPAAASAAALPYLPLAAGNRWRLRSGAVLDDAGAQTIACTCSIAGRAAERIDASSPGGNYLSSLFFTRGPWSPGSLDGRTLTYLVGSSADRGNTLVLAYQSADGRILGYPAIDDRAVPGEALTLLNHDGTTNEQSIVLTTGERLTTDSGVLLDVASARLSAGGTSVVFAFARGVGFASFAYAGGTTNLAAYALAPPPATSAVAAAVRAVPGDGLAAAGRVVDALIRQ
ncbi:MAG: hypothetical protein JOZ24_01120 [Candidatus Eremiobacteraeota bacterium]|nr:hypothetical protein [Candidatus Eremiobacteraeota bacterium]